MLCTNHGDREAEFIAKNKNVIKFLCDECTEIVIRKNKQRKIHCSGHETDPDNGEVLERTPRK